MATFVAVAFDLPGVAGLWFETFPFLSQHLPFIPTFTLKVMEPNALPLRLLCLITTPVLPLMTWHLIHPRALDNLKPFVSKGKKKWHSCFINWAQIAAPGTQKWYKQSPGKLLQRSIHSSRMKQKYGKLVKGRRMPEKGQRILTKEIKETDMEEVSSDQIRSHGAEQWMTRDVSIPRV